MSDITVLLTITSTYTLQSSSLPTSGGEFLTTLVMLTTVRKPSPTVRSILSTSSSVFSTPPPSTKSISRTAPTDAISSTSPTSATKSTITTPSEIASNIKSFESGTNSSLKIGLAIGIPVGVVGIFMIVILLFVWVQKRKFKKQRQSLLPYKNVNYLNDLERSSQEELKSEETAVHNPYSQSVKDSPLLPPAPPFISRSQLNPDSKGQSVRYYIRDRLSKVINEETYPIPKAVFSPMILKRFKLSKPDSYTPADSQSTARNKKNLKLSVVDTQQIKQKYIVAKGYERILEDEITINIGDIVSIEHEYPDGWSQIEMINGALGMVPKRCLKAI